MKKTIQFFQKKHWIALSTWIASLTLAISLLLPTSASAAAPYGPEGNWQLIDSPITLELFDGQDYGRMYCNSYFGSYQFPQDIGISSSCGELTPIRFTEQASTEVGCEGNQKEYEYLQALNSVQAYEVCDDTLLLLSYPEPLFFEKIGY
ncbi:MAG: META domain-containing protein [Symploca sp. SIO3E6]|nr:META domain-containing protein [Caldora sp. SIO3E6]